MAEQVRVLGVDDSVTIRGALEIILEEEGFLIELASTGTEAIEKAKAFRPDIILLDFILPDMRGTDVCRVLAEDPETRAIPVILISAKGAEIQQAYHQIASVKGYIAKPFTPETLTEMIAGVLAAEQAQPAAPEWTPADEVAADATPGVTPTAATSDLDAGDDADGEADDAPAVLPAVSAAERAALEVMFETLRAGLEGVYVEEVDTPRGAAADEAKSYAELASHVTQQLAHIPRSVARQQRVGLGGDGTLRTLDEALLDAYRRVCRLVFRAVTAGAITGDAVDATQPRLLVVCAQEHQLFQTLQLVGRPDECHLVAIGRDFRRVPLLTRIYGPTHLIVELAIDATLRTQLMGIRRLSEGRRMHVIGVACATSQANERVQECERRTIAALPVDTIVAGGPDVLALLREHLFAVARPPRSTLATAPVEGPVSATA